MEAKHIDFQHHKEGPYFFKDLSFVLEPNKIHALHGKNGIGKTVLLQLLNNTSPSQGAFSGEVLGNENAVLVNQRFDQMIADAFSFRENVQFACMGRFPKLFSRLHQPHFYPDFLKKFHIDMSTPANKLSGGQRQILALLMVLQQQADVLLLDEPTATLDEQNAALVFDFLQTLTEQNVTILVVCHDRDLIKQYTTGQHLHLTMDSSGLRKLTNNLCD